MAAALLAAPPALAATPPAQPKSGPGGADYSATDVVKRVVGTASAATYVFHGAGAPATPRPVVVFMHAWGAVNPQIYGGWIEHLARKGNLVLFPKYQEVNRIRPADATEFAAKLVKDAFTALASDEQAKPDPGKVAVLGHLAGAAVAVNLAALAKEHDLPVPKLIFAIMPGGIASEPNGRGVVLADLAKIDAGTMLVTLIGDREAAPSDRAARRILRETTSIPPDRKLFVRALSDSHGFPSLSATLSSPGAVKAAYDAAALKIPPDPPRDPKAPRERWRWTADMALSGEQTVLVNQLNIATTDSLDYFAYWKTFDMAFAAALAGKTGESLRDDDKFTDMGRWSDGWPVKRLYAETPRAEAGAPAQRREVSPAMLPVPSKRRPEPQQRRRQQP